MARANFQNITTLLATAAAQSAASEQARRLYAPRLADRFNPLSFIVLDENKLSEMIAFLLDPRERHEQADAFLRLFCRMLGLDETLAWRNALVQCEAATHRIEAYQRRMDIVVECDRFVIAIENKPWAVDQPAQVTAYLEHLAAIPGHGHCLVYLTPNGHAPTETSISEALRIAAIDAGRLKLVSYAQLSAWLGECRSVCKAQRVTAFLNDLEHLVGERVMGIEDVNDQTALIDTVLSSPAHTEAALQIGFALPAIKQTILKGLVGNIRQIVGPTHDWALDDKFAEATYPHLKLQLLPKVEFRFQFEDGGLLAPYFGVWDELKVLPAEQVRVRLDPVLGKARHETKWPWWKWASAEPRLSMGAGDFVSSAEAWMRLSEPRFAASLVEIAKTVQTALADL